MPTTRGGGHRRHWRELTPRQQATILTLASVQLSLAATAWADLAFRPPGQVNGSKPVWAAIIAINGIGPVLYFLRGRRPVEGPGSGRRSLSGKRRRS
ncbi:hypothetical protein GCM10011512_15110 [Tersicoccus solisilvae]|uniref:Cardiolipin synthase N-terminal domain-containing protein n=1 Tax=Tersicoccus solisilvae TaxID=1882339 RepID=A0ABQ1P1H0_9MICC|nr:PLDc N-terminal domain-containing protein [Tersicoccus solisilvae]GGC89157.1 hypothetical protein GCM10011512_15110 [Tersicoccus solisilvae]